MEDRRSNPSKEWNVSIRDKEFGAHREYSQSRYPQTEVQKDREGVRERDKGAEKTKDRVRMEEGWGSNTQSVTKFGF